ncbi:MAG: hypothetical protein MZV65_38445 [Chromatiales bacterium]|nr:hypothetical protein [Chromatiales bacterium]
MATIFETIIQPLLPLLKEEVNRLKDDEPTYKLSLHYFTLSLIYAVIQSSQVHSFIDHRNKNETGFKS